MIHFVDFDKVSSVVQEANINVFIIPVSADAVTAGKFYQAMSSKFPDFETKATQAITKVPKAGYCYKVKLDSGHVVHLAVFKNVDKFGTYILDIVSSLSSIIDDIKHSYADLSNCKVLLPLPTADELKLSDGLYTPPIIDIMNVKGLDVYLASDGEYAKYLESISDEIAYYKRDSWKANWMLTLDDIRFVEILSTVIQLTHSYKISKSGLVKCYYICHQHGMYPKLEFYDTEFGKFFKMFLVKCLGLTNHGLLMNTQHYSKAEPPKFSAILGPNYPLLKYLAYTQLKTDGEFIMKVAKAVQKDYIDSYKDKPDYDPNASKSYNKEPAKPVASSFNF